MSKTKTKAKAVAKPQVYATAGELLVLSTEDRYMVELRVAVSYGVRQLREKTGLTQADLAVKIESSQARVARIETTSRGVSLDLAFRAYFALGGTLEELNATRSVLSRGAKSNGMS